MPWVGKGSKPLRRPPSAAIVFQPLFAGLLKQRASKSKDGQAAKFILADGEGRAAKMARRKAVKNFNSIPLTARRALATAAGQ